mmetsp:Transcript_24307/g.63477  ORF Transcript_24307/g.63477 Transcript_24307/m.63477 type:complete len:217 (-) Transcript_24307:1553-2203(-)
MGLLAAAPEVTFKSPEVLLHGADIKKRCRECVQTLPARLAKTAKLTPPGTRCPRHRDGAPGRSSKRQRHLPPSPQCVPLNTGPCQPGRGINERPRRLVSVSSHLPVRGPRRRAPRAPRRLVPHLVAAARGVTGWPGWHRLRQADSCCNARPRQTSGPAAVAASAVVVAFPSTMLLLLPLLAFTLVVEFVAFAPLDVWLGALAGPPAGPGMRAAVHV